MREIKFRGITYQENKWAYGSLVLHEEKYPVISSYDSDADERSWLLVAPETVGQFTGRYDATTWDELTSAEQSAYLASNKDNTPETWKGKEIYEGDILEKRSYADNDNNGIFNLVAEDNNEVKWKKSGWNLLEIKIPRYKEEHRVIGNIHDNPELAPQDKEQS